MMVLLRRFEERAREMYTKAKIGGYCHLNLGEEATIIGLMAALQEPDYIFTNYREHGYIIARGVEPGPVMAELFGPRNRRFRWARRLDAPVRRLEALYGRLWHCWRASAAGNWCGICA